jgi:transcriptional regulator GlxA family with amidase domain
MVEFDLLVMPGASPSAAGITVDTLAAANRLAGDAVEQPFAWRVLSPRGSNTELRYGIGARARSMSRAKPARVVVVPGLGCPEENELRAMLGRPDAAVAVRWLKRAATAGSTIAASCTGAFLLGAAGLLDGRHCTTSWWLTRTLAAWHPQARVDQARMVIEDGRIVTAGASLAHLDLMLRLVHRFGGAALAQATASHLVVDQRPSQAAYIIPTALGSTDPVAQAVDAHVSSRIAKPMTLDSLARALHLSPRTLARRMRALTGQAPMSYVRSLRVAAATHLLRTTKLPVSKVAERVGLADASVLYRLVKRHTGVAPAAIRRG